MRLWKQLLLSLVVVAVALCLWVFLVPGAGETLAKMGVPQPIVAALSPQAADGASEGAGAGRGQGGGQGGGQGRGPGGGRATTVVTEDVATGTVNDRLSAIGSGEAIQSVVVMPQAAGTIEEILVEAGEKVAKGDVLARLDDDEQVIARDRAEVALRSATERSDSLSNLRSVSRLDVLDAQIAQETAKLELATAELNLKRREILSPINGVAGIVPVNVGDNVTTQTAIVTIDDRSSLLVDFWAPERFATAISVDHPVEATSIARPGEAFTGVVQAIDNRVDPASRTLRVRARIENPDDVLRAGMAFNVGMRFAGDTYPAVDPLAVQWDAEGSYVWQVVDGKSVKTRVRIIQRNPDVVLVDADLTTGDAVVIEGLQRVREGAPVQLAGQPDKAEVASQ
ncbi:efflux RND transporter periplasmic adaptor subunit [Rhizobium halophilum]|uniref:efflux RND transporter periplasmic adaptor subunit n=1 Tax=Rhizobium halophilum TaxID=2846852 RepID=UPI001EFCD298|nr:efflux RND transporter periplasmic adaptor subunit [Rhizobium halophilum]MCF6368264.1 efflux RND transporter periplasmic adaptor subunit [Rhizobium halophilum]